MSYASLLINWCSVYRYTTGAADDYGKPVETWAVVVALGDIPCRLMATPGREILIGAKVVVADYKLFLDDVTITEQDRVYVYAGTVPVWAFYEILLVSNRQDGTGSHHKELDIRTVR